MGVVAVEEVTGEEGGGGVAGAVGGGGEVQQGGGNAVDRSALFAGDHFNGAGFGVGVDQRCDEDDADAFVVQHCAGGFGVGEGYDVVAA